MLFELLIKCFLQGILLLTKIQRKLLRLYNNWGFLEWDLLLDVDIGGLRFFLNVPLGSFGCLKDRHQRFAIREGLALTCFGAADALEWLTLVIGKLLKLAHLESSWGFGFLFRASWQSQGYGMFDLLVGFSRLRMKRWRFKLLRH